MVTTNDQEGEVDLEQRLSGEWQNMLSSQQAAAEFLSSSQKKPLGGDQGQVAFFNNKLVSRKLEVGLDNLPSNLHLFLAGYQ